MTDTYGLPADLYDRTLLLVRHGSHAYGLNTETSDLDIKGVAVGTPAVYHGFDTKFEQWESSEPYDCVVYEVRKFFRLAAACNPNIIEVLWVDDEDILRETALGARIREHRGAFLSRRARHTFAGYARSQLKRIKGHRRWLLDPPKAKPTRADFGLPERTVIPRDQLLAAHSRIQRQLDAWELELTDYEPHQRVELRNHWDGILEAMSLGADAQFAAAGRQVGYDDNFLNLLDRERRYRSSLENFNQYEGWRRNRNPARSALEASHGFDTKHASHLVRLLRMCREILETGQVRVKRPDRQELLAIRRGEWKYDELIEWADAQDAELSELVKTSPLPVAPDKGALDALCQAIVREGIA
jgi:uncharacterized protein